MASRRSKKDDDNREPERKKRRKRTNKSEAPQDTEHCPLTCGGLWKFTLNNLLMTLLVLLLGIGGAHFFAASAQHSAGLAGVRAAADVLAARLADHVVFYQQQIDALSDELDLGGRIAQADGDFGEAEALLGRALAGRPQVVFYTAEIERLERHAGNEIGYALFDMLRKAANGELPPAETRKTDAGREEIVLVHPIRSAGQVVAIARVALSADAVKDPFQGMELGEGRLVLSQRVSDNNWTLAESAAGGAMPDAQVAVAGTLWVVGYEYRGGGPASGLILPAILLVVGFAVVLASSLAGLKGLRAKLDKDARDARRIVNELLGKGITEARSARLPELQELLDWLAKAAYVHGTSGGSVSTASEKKRPPRADGIRSAQVTKPFGTQAVEGYEVEEHEGDSSGSGAAPSGPVELSPEIFQAYDIRGAMDKELGREAAYELGRAIGSEALQSSQDTVILANDGRQQAAEIAEALERGMLAAGCNVLDIGVTTTPMLYFATHFLGGNSGVMVTGSDRAGEYVSMKLVINGKTLAGAELEKLRQRVAAGDLLQGEGQVTQQELRPDYIERILDDVQLARPLNVVVDAGNGAAGRIAPDLFRGLGCEVTELYCDPDDTFPNHPPEPDRPENLRDLAAKIKETKADIGIAFDSDGDRLAVVDSQGKMIWPDRLLILLARDVLSRQPGADVIYDVKSTRHLATEILNSGGRPIMWKSGHTLIKEMMKQSDALLAGELSGHIFFKERWYGFDDALYAAARLLEILAMESSSSAELFAEIPEEPSTPVLLARTPKGASEKLMRVLGKKLQIPDAKLVTVDGIRAEFEDGWGVVRASNTRPALSFRFEAVDEKALQRIQEVFRTQIAAVAPEFKLPF